MDPIRWLSRSGRRGEAWTRRPLAPDASFVFDAQVRQRPLVRDWLVTVRPPCSTSARVRLRRGAQLRCNPRDPAAQSGALGERRAPSPHPSPLKSAHGRGVHTAVPSTHPPPFMTAQCVHDQVQLKSRSDPPSSRHLSHHGASRQLARELQT